MRTMAWRQGNDAVEERTALMTPRCSDGAENDAAASSRLEWRRKFVTKDVERWGWRKGRKAG